MCLGKEKFESSGLAREVAGRMHHMKGVYFQVYRCPLCGWHHVGEGNRDAHTFKPARNKMAAPRRIL